MSLADELFRELMKAAPFQPATNLWRAVELDAIVRHGLPEGRGLDLGCGDGRLTRLLSSRLSASRAARTWSGVDIDSSEALQAQATQFYQHVHVGSAASIPEVSGSFDFVFSNSVLEHIEPIEAVLLEVARLLRRGGTFVFTVPGSEFHRCLRGPVIGQKSDSYLRRIDARCLHLRYWSVSDWKTRLEASGLEFETSIAYLSERQTQRWEALSALTAGVLYRIAGGSLRPIELQRRLGMRGRESPFASLLGGALAPLLALGTALESDAPATAHGCLLVRARKP